MFILAVLQESHGILFQPGKYDEQGNQVYGEMKLPAARPKTLDGTTRVQDAVCAPGILAATSPESGRIFCCPHLFNTFAPRAALNVKQYMPLDKLSSGSRVLLHELVHLWFPSECSRRRDSTEKSLTRDNVVEDQLAVDMTSHLPRPRPKVRDPGQRVYNFDRCHELADDYPSETVQTAETFAVFAVVSKLLTYHTASLMSRIRDNSIRIGCG